MLVIVALVHDCCACDWGKRMPCCI